MSVPMKLGLVGAGCIGQLRAKALAQVDGCVLSGIADVDPVRARAMAPSLEVNILEDVRVMRPINQVRSGIRISG